jgi:hypothetical protein
VFNRSDCVAIRVCGASDRFGFSVVAERGTENHSRLLISSSPIRTLSEQTKAEQGRQVASVEFGRGGIGNGPMSSQTWRFSGRGFGPVARHALATSPGGLFAELPRRRYARPRGARRFAG